MIKSNEKLAVLAVSMALAFGTFPALADSSQSGSFEKLDVDQDGYISSIEASQKPELIDQWSEVDTNSDNRLDESEFSALEEEQPVTE